MEKNIKKRVCWLAAVLSAVFVVISGYGFFFSSNGYCHKMKEAARWNTARSSCFGGNR